MAGFRVDLRALTQAADGIVTTMDEVATVDVHAATSAVRDVGHDGLGRALGTFGTRWAIGVLNLTHDAQAIATRLDTAAKSYLATDEARDYQFGVIGRADGADPGMG